jgi:hypothetical protein
MPEQYRTWRAKIELIEAKLAAPATAVAPQAAAAPTTAAPEPAEAQKVVELYVNERYSPIHQWSYKSTLTYYCFYRRLPSGPSS